MSNRFSGGRSRLDPFGHGANDPESGPTPREILMNHPETIQAEIERVRRFRRRDADAMGGMADRQTAADLRMLGPDAIAEYEQLREPVVEAYVGERIGRSEFSGRIRNLDDAVNARAVSIRAGGPPPTGAFFRFDPNAPAYDEPEPLPDDRIRSASGMPAGRERVGGQPVSGATGTVQGAASPPPDAQPMTGRRRSG